MSISVVVAVVVACRAGVVRDLAAALVIAFVVCRWTPAAMAV